MSKNSLLILLGGLVILSSFLGIPSSWKTLLVGVLGLAVVVVALLLQRDIASGTLCMHLEEDKRTDSYAQNGAIQQREEDTTRHHEGEETHTEYKG